MADRPVLTVIIGSTRPTRIAPAIARWFVDLAEAEGSFEVQVVDLKELDLPFMDEPSHPMLAKYEGEHTKAWSAVVAGSDAFVLVMPEYNHSFTAPVKNAIDYLHAEWAHKPLGFVSYGGVSAGLRAVQALKPVLAALRMTPVVEAVAIPNVGAHIGPDGSFAAPEGLDVAAAAMLGSLGRSVEVLKAARG